MTTPEFQQQNQGFMTYPTSDWHKLAFKAPVHLWRLGLQPILGQKLMLITHTGRKSGLPRRTLVEYHVLDGQKYAPSGFGERAQWYKNIVADPNVTIQTAQGAEHVKARRVTEDAEMLRVYSLLKQHNPTMLQWYRDTLEIEDTPEDVVAKKDRLYFLTFDLTDEPTPPPQEADLKWVWWLVGALMVLLLLRRK
jgi:deazaflavin-dependent oxidoreductase (nitroreductase family)